MSRETTLLERWEECHTKGAQLQNDTKMKKKRLENDGSSRDIDWCPKPYFVKNSLSLFRVESTV